MVPDGSVSAGQKLPDSTAFYSDSLLVQADDFLRKGALQDAIAKAAPGKEQLSVSAGMGIPVGRGYLPVGKAVGLAGPPLRVDNIMTVQGVYQFNSTKGIWETTTIYPLARP